MAIQLKDAWIGLFVAPAGDSYAAPIITHLRCFIEELKSNATNSSSFSNARVNFTNFDVAENSPSGIQYVVTEIASYGDLNELKQQKNTLPLDWKVISTNVISDSSKGIIGNDNHFSFILNNIPADPKNYYHKFRFKFIGRNGRIAKILPFEDKTVTGTMVERTFTFTASEEWKDDEFAGFEINLFDTNDIKINSNPIVILSNTGDDIVVQQNLLLNSEFLTISDIASFEFADSKYLYILGENGLGIKFNGIEDLSEIIGAFDVEAEYLRDTWVSGNSNNFVLKSNSVRLRFKNMWNHLAASGVMMADGSHSIITQEQFRSAETYVVFAHISDELPPENWYPSPEDANGKWYIVNEFPVEKVDYNIKPKITVTVHDLPRKQYVSFWIGLKTKWQQTTATTDWLPDQTKMNINFGRLGGTINVSGEAELETTLL